MVNIQLEDEVAAGLKHQAEALGLSLEAFLKQLALVGTKDAAPTLSGEEFDRLLDEASVNGPPSTATFSRADIYDDHD